MTAEPPLRVAVCLISTANAYQRLLHAALEPLGVRTLDARPTPWWVWRHRRAFDVLHLHWIELVLDRRGGAPVSAAAFAAVASSVVLARLLGKRVVWTVHNVEPHDPAHPRIERALFGVVARLSHTLIVHTDTSAALVRARLPAAGRTLVIPHGNFVGAYPDATADRGEMRARYGLGDDDLVLLAFGQIRPYKRLLRTAEALAATDDARVRLVIVGGQTDRAEAERLRVAAAADPRIVLDLRHVADSEVAGLHAMADAAVVPYVDSFASGVLLLALGFGLPVLAPANGAAAEIALAGALIDFDGTDLAGALETLRSRPPDERSSAARASAARVPWSASATRHLEVYRATGTANHAS